LGFNIAEDVLFVKASIQLIFINVLSDYWSFYSKYERISKRFHCSLSKLRGVRGWVSAETAMRRYERIFEIRVSF
jgi:hypothetical protein